MAIKIGLESKMSPHDENLFYLVLNDFFLTQDVMVKPHIPYQMECVMCSEGGVETAKHLLF